MRKEGAEASRQGLEGLGVCWKQLSGRQFLCYSSILFQREEIHKEWDQQLGNRLICIRQHTPIIEWSMIPSYHV